jgi:hypothetical protein
MEAELADLQEELRQSKKRKRQEDEDEEDEEEVVVVEDDAPQVSTNDNVGIVGVLTCLPGGVWLAQQKHVFVYSLQNTQQEEEVLKNAEEVKKSAGTNAVVFRTTCHASVVPSVVGGLTQGFKKFVRVDDGGSSRAGKKRVKSSR